MRQSRENSGEDEGTVLMYPNGFSGDRHFLRDVRARLNSLRIFKLPLISWFFPFTSPTFFTPWNECDLNYGLHSIRRSEDISPWELFFLQYKHTSQIVFSSLKIAANISLLIEVFRSLLLCWMPLSSTPGLKNITVDYNDIPEL